MLQRATEIRCHLYKMRQCKDLGTLVLLNYKIYKSSIFMYIYNISKRKHATADAVSSYYMFANYKKIKLITELFQELQ